MSLQFEQGSELILHLAPPSTAAQLSMGPETGSSACVMASWTHLESPSFQPRIRACIPLPQPGQSSDEFVRLLAKALPPGCGEVLFPPRHRFLSQDPMLQAPALTIYGHQLHAKPPEPAAAEALLQRLLPVAWAQLQQQREDYVQGAAKTLAAIEQQHPEDIQRFQAAAGEAAKSWFPDALPAGLPAQGSSSSGSSSISGSSAGVPSCRMCFEEFEPADMDPHAPMLLGCVHLACATCRAQLQAMKMPCPFCSSRLQVCSRQLVGGWGLQISHVLRPDCQNNYNPLPLQ
jgi:hypothetical protein